MKLKYTTKFYIFTNLFLILFRLIQILFLTESKTTFLKQDLKAISVIGTVVGVALLGLLAFRAYFVSRKPIKAINKGLPVAILYGVSAAFYLIGGIITLIYTTNGFYCFALSLLTAASCGLFAAASITECKFPKLCALPPIALWLLEFILAYNFYTERTLRVRIVFETLAICSVLLFYIRFGKLVSRVSANKNYHHVYVLGLISSTLCFTSIIPEFIAIIVGQGDKVTASCVSLFSLFAAGIFVSTFTINTFKSSNTIKKEKPIVDNSSANNNI